MKIKISFLLLFFIVITIFFVKAQCTSEILAPELVDPGEEFEVVVKLNCTESEEYESYSVGISFDENLFSCNGSPSKSDLEFPFNQWLTENIFGCGENDYIHYNLAIGGGEGAYGGGDSILARLPFVANTGTLGGSASFQIFEEENNTVWFEETLIYEFDSINTPASNPQTEVFVPGCAVEIVAPEFVYDDEEFLVDVIVSCDEKRFIFL